MDRPDQLELLDAALGALASGLVICDLDGRVSWANPAGQRILGSAAGQMIGHHLSDIRGEFSAMLWPTDKGEVLLLPDRPGRESRILGFTSRDLSDASNKPLGTVISCSDITDLKQQRQEEAHRRRLADLGRVVATLAHEIRNPVYAINTLASLLEVELQDPEQREMATRICEEAMRISRLVDDILGFGRNKPLVRKPIDAVALLERLVTDLEQGEGDRSGGPIPIRLEIEASAKVQARAWNLDADALRQVLSNLVRNALQAVAERDEAAPPRTPDHDVRVHMLVYDGHLELEVIDRGVGISESDMPHVFDAFYTRRSGGTGLGLAVASALVQKHGGTLSMRSEVGMGTSVVVRIPR